MIGLARIDDERLDELRQRVEPARGDDLGRQTGEEIGIDQRGARQHEGAAQARLDPVLGRGQHRVLGDLRAGARGRRDRDERERAPGERLAAADDLQIVERIAAVREQRGNRLAGVERAAAAERDHEVAGARRAPAATPARAVSTVGSPLTENKVVARSPAASSNSSDRPRAGRALAGDHQRGASQARGDRARPRRAQPAPKTMRVGAASSNAAPARRHAGRQAGHDDHQP